jgi:gluconolactonase
MNIDLPAMWLLLEDSMGTTNGVEVSPDGRLLYVNESVQRNVWVYDIEAEWKFVQQASFSSFCRLWYGWNALR